MEVHGRRKESSSIVIQRLRHRLGLLTFAEHAARQRTLLEAFKSSAHAAAATFFELERLIGESPPELREDAKSMLSTMRRLHVLNMEKIGTAEIQVAILENTAATIR